MDHGRPMREWRWPLPRWYNGFSPEERVRGWQAMWWLIEEGHIPLPSVCSITGVKEGEPYDEFVSGAVAGAAGTVVLAKIAYHSENYYDPFELYPISATAHRLLHRRFFDPAPWQELVDRCSRTGDEWFTRLEPTHVDLAGRLRHRYGQAVTDIMQTALAGVKQG